MELGDSGGWGVLMVDMFGSWDVMTAGTLWRLRCSGGWDVLTPGMFWQQRLPIAAMSLSGRNFQLHYNLWHHRGICCSFFIET